MDSKLTQHEIMLFIDSWIKTKKTTVPKKEILNTLQKKGIQDHTINNALNSLIRNRYISRASTSTRGGGTFYKQHRSF